MAAVTSGDLAPGQILCLDNYLEPGECETLRDGLRYVWWWDSRLAYIDPHGKLSSGLSVRRTSSTSSEEWMDEEMRAQLRQLEQRLVSQLCLAPDRFELWQAARYRRGQRFDEHHDAGFFGSSPEGERTHTIVVYLEDHERGGGIVFPDLGVRYQPKAGRVLVWRNLLDDGTVDRRMRHSGRPAVRTKTILTTWVRQNAITPH
ncbi:prolyl 4-hydroxylase [Rhizobium sp. BK313]|uniref:2OG-Fe(II) oxygenase n=1 Tax=Rhizobium sp. BK313 TaxID=2587081 RepID=UPI001060917D|nr:2OG-Fe(II) oxygenase [Rhizobium sp. BK313]MBB3457516.1 prolyl 4-hydroxylase [Rhizobium sp. BK313]